MPGLPSGYPNQAERCAKWRRHGAGSPQPVRGEHAHLPLARRQGSRPLDQPGVGASEYVFEPHPHGVRRFSETDRCGDFLDALLGVVSKGPNTSKRTTFTDTPPGSTVSDRTSSNGPGREAEMPAARLSPCLWGASALPCGTGSIRSYEPTITSSRRWLSTWPDHPRSRMIPGDSTTGWVCEIRFGGSPIRIGGRNWSGLLGSTRSPSTPLRIRERKPMNWQDRIIVDPTILVGKPVIKGTRIAVEFLVELLAEELDPRADPEQLPATGRGRHPGSPALIRFHFLPPLCVLCVLCGESSSKKGQPSCPAPYLCPPPSRNWPNSLLAWRPARNWC